MTKDTTESIEIEVFGIDSSELTKEEKLATTHQLFGWFSEEIGTVPEDVALYEK